MTGLEVFISIVILGTVISGILLLKQSAKKFNLTDEQLKKIKDREKILKKEEEEQ